MKILHYKRHVQPGDLYMRTRGMLLIIAAISVLLAFSGCSAGQTTSATSGGSSTVQTTTTGGTTSAPTTGTDSITSVQPTGSTQKVFTLSELGQYDGNNGQPAYVAVDGVVYDVTNAKGWNSGSHQGYSAGKDLTQEILKAPHGTQILSSLPIVGILQG
jgi:predicted heme/steroid binding protein